MCTHTHAAHRGKSHSLLKWLAGTPSPLRRWPRNGWTAWPCCLEACFQEAGRAGCSQNENPENSRCGGTRRNRRPHALRGKQSGCSPSCRAEGSHATRQLVPKRTENVSTQKPAALFTITQVSISRWTDKWSVARPHSGALLAVTKCSADTCYKMDDPWKLVLRERSQTRKRRFL